MERLVAWIPDQVRHDTRYRHSGLDPESRKGKVTTYACFFVGFTIHH